MVRVTIARLGGGRGGRHEPGVGAESKISRIAVYGHAGYGKHGHDIVCAAASVTIYTAAGALEELAGASGFYDEAEGSFEIRRPPSSGDSGRELIIDTILEAACIGYRQIARGYPKHLRVDEVAE
jgi:uncharacterized protein YsxB (DUF464 family)